MKHRLLIAAAATALMAVPTLATAQDSGVYIKGQAGYGVVTDADIVPTNSAFPGMLGEVQGQGDLALGLALGYDYGNGWRIELEGSQLQNDLGAIDNQPFTTAGIRSNALMLNAFYDFNDFGRFEPYIGAGLGIVSNDLTLAAQDFQNGPVLVRHPVCVTQPPNAAAFRACQVDDKDTGFGWNLMAGLGYNITDNLTWDTTYKYSDLGDADLDGTYIQAGVPGTGGVFASLGATVEDLTSHTLMTGFRYRFGKVTPPPPPPPPVVYTCDDGITTVTDLALCPPATVLCWDGVTEVTDLDLCPPEPVRLTCPDGLTVVSDLAMCPVNACEEQFRQELIYYEFDVAESAETRNTINRILDVGQFCRIDNIRVVGHTDTSGPASYNQGLSQRRAEDAREELIRQGVNAGMIASEGKGETEPFVQTGDGVREQLNRRTEVLLTLSEVGTAMMNN
ncbi:outer membrane beta-barrel protein [uncultured Algimonas sp.]|uniref:OmpA family protein n=1 Tax=uncultured Algimonas sp. TaxID=1547920 RepID=UPI0026260304|nr:outer membrane beta-barrel protein [uncultured Algimonas sp.]